MYFFTWLASLYKLCFNSYPCVGQVWNLKGIGQVIITKIIPSTWIPWRNTMVEFKIIGRNERIRWDQLDIRRYGTHQQTTIKKLNVRFH